MARLASTRSPLRMGQFRGTDDSQRALRHTDEDAPAGGGEQTAKDRQNHDGCNFLGTKTCHDVKSP